MNRFRLVAWFVPILLLAAGTVLAAGAADSVGVVRKASGVVRVVRAGVSLPAPVGTRLLPGDAIETGSDGAIGIILRDDSLVSLGPDSSFSVTSFRFSPAQGKLGLVARLSRGTLEYLSGLIGKLAPDSVRFDTPVSSIGIRGTHFLLKSDPGGGE